MQNIPSYFITTEQAAKFQELSDAIKDVNAEIPSLDLKVYNNYVEDEIFDMQDLSDHIREFGQEGKEYNLEQKSNLKTLLVGMLVLDCLAPIKKIIREAIESVNITFSEMIQLQEMELAKKSALNPQEASLGM